MEETHTCQKCHCKWRRSQLKQVPATASNYQSWIYYVCPKCNQALFSEKLRGIREARQ